MAGPEHYKAVRFPELRLWSNNERYMTFHENRAYLERVIPTYLEKY